MIAPQKFFLLSLLLVTLTTACQPSANAPDEKQTPVTPVSTVAQPVTPEITTIAFDETTHAFGEVAKGDKAVHRFTFKNTGTAPLIIENVKPSCQCTVSEYTHEPVPPGSSGFVETSMEAKNVGIFKKSATVTVNTDPRNHILEFSGEVVE